MALASSVRIEIDGKKIFDFMDLCIEQKINGIQEFRVSCRMDTFEDQDGFVLDRSKKYIGSIITIAIDSVKKGNESSPGVFFRGIINSVSAAKSDLSHEDRVILSGYSPDVLLKDHPGSRSFEKMSLNQLINEVLKPYPRDVLKTSVNPAYKEQIQYCVQYKENTFDFLRRLAARYGEWMYYSGSELIIGSPKGKDVDLILGKDLKTFNFSLNLEASDFKYISYDYLNAKDYETATEKSTGKSQQNDTGKHAFDQSKKQYSQSAVLDYQHMNVQPNNYAKEQKNAVELEASAIALGMSGAEGSSENMHLVPGTKIIVKAKKTKGPGEVDYGKYLVTGVKHRCDNLLNYDNDFTAVPSEAKVPGYADPEAFPRCEPQSAVVKDNNDPEKLGRVRVRFLWQGEKAMSPWIRVATPYSGDNRGFYFIPEIGDEVLVGFDAGDAERPFVMGSLYHGKNKPAQGYPDDNNSFKGIVTKSNLKIEFDEQKKQTTIETPGGNKVILSDDKKSILLQDQNQNKAELSSSGIVLDSPKDIKITAKSKITIQGTGGVDISSTADAKLSGLNINLDANASIAAKGKAAAEFSSIGNTTVKGAVVMIN